MRFFLKLNFTNNKVESLSVHSDEDENTISKSLEQIVFIANLAGIMPLSDISSSSPKFEWRSSGSLYAFFHFLVAVLLTAFQIRRMIETGHTMKNLRLLIFFVSGVITSINFFLLASRWPIIIKRIHSDDTRIIHDDKTNLKKNVRIIFTSYILIAAIEHFLEDIHKILLVRTCEVNFWKSLEIFLKYFIIEDVFTIIDFTFTWGILLEIMSLLLTFSWTFIDIFIIIISWCLAQRFSQITRRVKFLVKTKVSDEKQWERLRCDYCRLCQLCRLLDHELSFIILQSFASNMFFILTQLFNSFQFRVYWMEEIYFCFSFLTLILRMFFICVVGGKVNSESSKPIIYLSEAPTEIYNVQMQRLAEYIHWNNTSLTGKRYFFITKGLLLNIAGAIITYELVLLQFEGHTITPNVVNETSKFFSCDSLIIN